MSGKRSNRFGQRVVTAVVSVFLCAAAIVSLPAPVIADGTGTLIGIVKSSHSGEPLPYASVVLVGTGRGTPAGREGRFVIRDVPAGAYRVEASYVGFETLGREVTVQSGRETFVEFSLREDLFRTSEIVVTATRTRRLLENVPVTTEVVRRLEIDEKGAESLSDILEYRPGITTATGSSGEQFVYINGVDSKRILLLVDNIPQSGKLYDRIPLNRVDSDLIDHVEIVKGPGSAVYGNRAMGGVINVITKGYTREPVLGVKTRTGSNDLYSGSAVFSGSGAGVDYLVSADYLREGDYRTTGEIEIDELHSGGVEAKLRNESDIVGVFELKGGWRADGLESESLFMGGVSDNESSVENWRTSLVWDRDIGARAGAMVAAYYAKNERRYEYRIKDSPMPASADTTTDALVGVKSDFHVQALDRLRIDYGVDYSRNEYENRRLGEEQTRRQTGVFLQFEGEPVRDLVVVAGGRYDWITDVDPYFSPRASAMYTIGERLKLRGMWGRGFRAPSFIELYSDFQMPIPGMPIFVIGNPDLTPETSEGLSVGVEYLFGARLLLNANLFRNEFEDMIVDYQADPMTFSYLNVESAVFRGVETQARLYPTNDLTATVSYNYTDIDKEGDVAISTISPHTAMLSVSYSLFESRLRFTLRDQYQGERDVLVVSGHSGELTSVSKEAYNLLDLTVSWSINPFLDLRLGARNVGDYTDDEFGPYIGRTFFLGLETGIGPGGANR